MMREDARVHVDKVIEEAYNKLVNDTVGTLREFEQESMLFRVNSDLIDMWEKICCQVQGKKSDIWNHYLSIIKDVAEEEVRKVGFPLLKIMWLVTEDYKNWEENETAFNENDFISGISQKLVSRILFFASNYNLYSDKDCS